MTARRLLLACALLAAAAAGPASAGDAPAPGGAPPGGSQEQPSLRDDRDVLDASEKWLGLLDAGKLGAAWDGSSKVLQKAVTRANWIKGIGEARKPFGKVASRTRERFARTHSIPGAPDGDYAIIHFTTNFAGGKRASEELTWVYDPEGTIWRVSGYYIR